MDDIVVVVVVIIIIVIVIVIVIVIITTFFIIIINVISDPPNRKLDFVKPATRIGTILGEDGEEVVGLTVVRGELYVALANSSEIKVGFELGEFQSFYV